MNSDPLLEEIHETRAKLLAESGDLKNLIENLRRLESQEGPRVVAEVMIEPFPGKRDAESTGRDNSLPKKR